MKMCSCRSEHLSALLESGCSSEGPVHISCRGCSCEAAGSSHYLTASCNHVQKQRDYGCFLHLWLYWGLGSKRVMWSSLFQPLMLWFEINWLHMHNLDPYSCDSIEIEQCIYKQLYIRKIWLYFPQKKCDHQYIYIGVLYLLCKMEF